jgi:hypothetical protein
LFLEGLHSIAKSFRSQTCLYDAFVFLIVGTNDLLNDHIDLVDKNDGRDEGSWSFRCAGLKGAAGFSDDHIALAFRLICCKKIFPAHDPFVVSRSTCVFLALYVSSVAA